MNVNVQDLKTVDLEPRRRSACPIPGIGRKNGKATNITIRIDEGEQYRMGKLTLSQRRSRIRGWCSSRSIWRKYFRSRKATFFRADEDPQGAR